MSTGKRAPDDPPPPYTPTADNETTFSTPQPDVIPTGLPPLPQEANRPQYASSVPQSYESRPRYNYRPQSAYPDTQYRPQLILSQQPYENYTTSANGRLLYPPGYHCQKCGNSGYKFSNGHLCRSCFEQFAAPQSPNVHILPPAPYGTRTTFMNNGAPPRVVSPGDPSIGGVLCGACKGRGYMDDLGLGGFFGSLIGETETCKVCKGVGRLL
ncbi:hypothetical protein V1512DRAFT_208229 [Lipomyces arxii]|uniref:uncharacterized protein n=1 Tax=Lipomyces arxii TaxID=56418 RepID=UPI0034CD0F24